MLIVRYRLNTIMHEVFFNFSERKDALELMDHFLNIGAFAELDWVS